MTKKYCSLVLFIALAFFACKKDNVKSDDCFPGVITSRQIVDKPASIRQQSIGQFYIIEQGTIDTKLNPCNLPTEFQVDNLQVTISGDVKATVQSGPGPCCTDNFVITKISR
jgi:hypothetical protein